MGGGAGGVHRIVALDGSGLGGELFGTPSFSPLSGTTITWPFIATRVSCSGLLWRLSCLLQRQAFGLPLTLPRLKDSDVTWLYGPLHTAHVEPVRPLKVSSTVDRLGIDRPEGAKKPILKHRTLSEMLTIPMPSSPILEGMGMDDDIDGMADGDRPILHQTKSDTNIFRTRNGPTRKKSPPRGPISGKTTPLGDGGGVTPETQIPNGKRHISFNTFVEQCVAVEGPQEAPIEESDDDMLEMRSSTSTSSRSSRPSISRNASSSSAEHLTIVMIAPTMLKTNGNVASPSQPIMIYQPPPEYVSPPIAGAPAPPAFDFPSPTQQKSRWKGDDDDEYDSVGFDYFGGPDLGGGDASKQSQQPVQSHVGSSHPRSPVVGPPPPQPKWRQPANAIVSEPSSTSSSSTTSLNNVTSPPQPTRSILKVRAPGTTPPEPSSPPPSYFNYNPSPATGIGGMRGSTYEYSGPAGSPVASTAPIPVHPSGPASEEPRGRSSFRERGSSQYDRSTSRGTSSGSGTSHSPASSRSPIEPPTRRSQPGATQLDKLEEGVSWEPEPMDVDYVPERSSTQTPHSSPQVCPAPAICR